MKKISMLEIKQALKDPRFRDKLPLDLRPDVVKFLNNPGCACNVPLYRKILKDHVAELVDYFPGAEVVDEAAEVEKLAQNHWRVINCSINDLEKQLKNLGPGRKQIDVARYQDQVTVVVNELDLIY